MKKNIFIWAAVAIILILGLVLFFVLKTRNSEGSKTVVINKTNNGQILTLKAGDILQIELDTQEGTGYDWYIDNLDNEHLKLISHQTKSTSPDLLVGGPIRNVWQLGVLKSGISKVNLDYYRVWEGKDKAIEHFSVALQLK